ncbi:MAG: PqqD family protein [Bdellovibrionales bacterium]
MKSTDIGIYTPAPFCVSRFHPESESVELVAIGPQIHVYTIDGVCAFVWRQLDGKSTLPQIISRTVKEFDVSAARAKKDIETFIDELLSLGIIQER